MPNQIKGLKTLLFLLGFVFALPAWPQTPQASPSTTSSPVGQISPTATPSPEPPLKFSMNALVDTYYSFNFTNAAHSANGVGNQGYFPSNKGDYSYELNMAELAFTLKQGEGSVHFSVLGGEAANYFNSFAVTTSVGDDIFLYEAYASYHPQDWTFSFGRMATFMGLKCWKATRTGITAAHCCSQTPCLFSMKGLVSITLRRTTKSELQVTS